MLRLSCTVRSPIPPHRGPPWMNGRAATQKRRKDPSCATTAIACGTWCRMHRSNEVPVPGDWAANQSSPMHHVLSQHNRCSRFNALLFSVAVIHNGSYCLLRARHDASDDVIEKDVHWVSLIDIPRQWLAENMAASCIIPSDISFYFVPLIHSGIALTNRK